MLDENLPAFFLKPSPSGIKHHRAFYLSHHGSEPAPAYTLQHADPTSPSPTQKNCYAAALFDAFNPDVLFGEVLARPGWTQPTLSQEEIHKNGGIPPPPQPILPAEFFVQLYNPDQQVRVELKEGKWGASDSYEFAMPISTFRTPSASTLDRGQSDPASLAFTPKVQFVWRKESKLSKDLTCFMTGKSTDALEKKKSRRDPDIAIALWRSMRELTIYESNLARVEMEDPKGLEVVLLLSAVVIKDLFFGSKEHMRETFNIAAEPKLAGDGRKMSSPVQQFSLNGTAPSLGLPPEHREPPLSANDAKRRSLPPLQTTPPSAGRPPHPNTIAQRPNNSTTAASKAKPPNIRPPPPLPDPRAQWELDAETARLRALAESEAREAKRITAQRAKAEEAERKRLKKMVEAEEREAAKKREEIERETERLRKVYGVQTLPSRPATGPPPAAAGSIPKATKPKMGSNGLYVQPSPAANSAAVMSGANPGVRFLGLPAAPTQRPPAKKKSFWGLRAGSDDGASSAQAQQGRRLSKKGSAMW